MNGIGSNIINLAAGQDAQANPEMRRRALRQAVGEMVGTTFYGEMLKISRSSVGQGKYGHGGRGEKVFGAQLDMELARCAGAGTKNGLAETIYNHLAKGL